MPNDGSSLNETERKVRDAIKADLGKLGTIVAVKQEGDRVAVEVMSPNDFHTAASHLERVAPEIASDLNIQVDVKLTTYWPRAA